MHAEGSVRTLTAKHGKIPEEMKPGDLYTVGIVNSGSHGDNSILSKQRTILRIFNDVIGTQQVEQRETWNWVGSFLREFQCGDFRISSENPDLVLSRRHHPRSTNSSPSCPHFLVQFLVLFPRLFLLLSLLFGASFLADLPASFLGAYGRGLCRSGRLLGCLRRLESVGVTDEDQRHLQIGVLH